jgi:hypothetical protein
MEIWIHRNGQFAGRFSESTIREKVGDGSLSASDLAWNEAKSSWIPISELLATAGATPAATEGTKETEVKTVDAPRATPPPLPSIAAVLPATPIPSSGPPPLPVLTPAVGAAAGANQPATG